MKKILIIILAIIASFGMVSGASFFTTYQLNFPNEQATSILVDGGECTTNSCSTIGNTVELYDAAVFNSCKTSSLSSASNFNSCILPGKINGKIVNLLGTSNQVVTKVTTPSNFGYVTWFSANADSYIPKFDRKTNYVCNFDICIDPNTVSLDFVKKANAIANIGQLNVKNVDNNNLPLQIEVPVSIDQTVCSAYSLTNPNMYTPIIPKGYSDFSADTLISLELTKQSDNSLITKQSLKLPIAADKCAGLAAFSWTAPAGFVNENVIFKVTTDVVDNQVSSSIPSFTQVIENVYPADLTNSCYARVYDLTLANIPTNVMTTQNTQITTISSMNLSENLFASFSAGAFSGNTLNPIDFEAIVKFNGTVVSQKLFNSGANLKSYSTDLTNNIKNLAPGAYNVSLTARPISASCTNTHNVVLTQNLQLVEAQTYNTNFIVSDVNGNLLSNAVINLQLMNLLGTYNSTLNYNNTLTTNALGKASFNNLIGGTYKYVINKPGIGSTSNIVTINSDLDLYVTVNLGNVAPNLLLPANFTGYYKNPIVFDLRDYVVDANNAFDELNFTANIISGNISANLNKGIVTLTTTKIGVSNMTINVIDPSGAFSSSNFLVDFNNNAPAIINTFKVNKNDGQTPFKAIFNVNVNPVDGDKLTCLLNFGDGSLVSTTGDCSSLNGLSHIYNETGSYDAVLSVNDNSNPIVTANQMIYVYNRTGAAPKINSFTLTSSNGNLAPTNLALNWDVVHTNGSSITCNLRYGSLNHAVSCIGSTNINNYNITGISTFTLVATDLAGVQVLQSIPLTLVTATNLFDNTKLIVDKVIAPGKFTFKLQVSNEVFNLRKINIIPSITCNNIVNKYKNNQLNVQLISKVNNLNEFVVSVNTNDFKFNVPTDVACSFNVELFDNLGFNALKSSNVMFSYPQETKLLKSIRGKGTDIANFMNSAVADALVVGYNTIEFKVINGENFGKNLKISLTSSKLGINFNLDENLPAGKERKVQIPLFIDKTTKSGMYPVRISVSDGTDKQTRYSYLNIINNN